MQLLSGGNSGRVTVAITAIIGAVRSDVFALRGLRELPDFGEANAAVGWVLRARGKNAARRGRACIVDRPVNDLPSTGALANIFRGHDVRIILIRDAGAVDAGAESGGCNAVDPGVDVGFLLGQHTSALLLVEEDDCACGKAFLAC